MLVLKLICVFSIQAIDLAAVTTFLLEAHPSLTRSDSRESMLSNPSHTRVLLPLIKDFPFLSNFFYQTLSSSTLLYD